MKKLFLAAALMLAGTFAKAQTIFNYLNSPACSIEVEVYCIVWGDCEALPGGTGGSCPISGPSHTFTISAGGSGSLPAFCNTPACAGSSLVEQLYRVRMVSSSGGCGDWVEWFGQPLGNCGTIIPPTNAVFSSCSECGTSGAGTSVIKFQYDPATGDLDILEIP